MPCLMTEWWLAFHEWDVEPVSIRGEIVGAVFAKGSEIHVAVLPEHKGRWCTPRLWRWAVTDRLAKYGQVFTKGKHDNEFIRRAGFKPVSESNGITVFVRAQE